MPRRAKSVCNKQGCIELTHDRLCEEHERSRKREVARRRLEEGKVVDYGPQWPSIRKEYLEHHPNCVVCGGKATEVDHIIPYRISQSHNWDNLQSFCKPHHSSKTASVDGGFGNPSGEGRR